MKDGSVTLCSLFNLERVAEATLYTGAVSTGRSRFSILQVDVFSSRWRSQVPKSHFTDQWI